MQPQPVFAQDAAALVQFIGERLSAYRDPIVVLPERSHALLMSLVASARLVVLPSRADNLPNTCLEAMALGRVVMATRGASFEQLIEDKLSGLLVPQEDDSELAEAISRA